MDAVRIPPPLGLTVAAAVAAGSVYGWASGAGNARRGTPAATARRASSALFVGAGWGYLLTSLVDFGEHLRLEREATGHYFAMTAVPPGETLNHAATVATIGGLLLLARPLSKRRLTMRDGFVLAAPALILALGWRDELVYHRRRAAHREDIMHTVAHLALGGMLVGLFLRRVVT